MTASKHSNRKDDESSIPSTLRPLIQVYKSLPPICLPSTNFNVSFTLASAFSLFMIRTVFWHFLLHVGWPSRSKMTTDAAASLASISHSLVLCLHLAICFYRNPNAYVPSARLEASPQWWQDAATALLELCTGYMIFDAVCLVKDMNDLGVDLSEFEYVILAHHALTSLYMVSCRLVRAGHVSAMMLMLTGEISNPLMNGMFVTRFAIQLNCCNSENMLRLHSLLELSFAALYVVLRIAIGPLCAIHLTWDLLSKRGRTNIPIGLSLIWILMVWTVLYGSMPFVEDAIDMLRDGWELKYPPNFDYGDRYAIQGEL